MISTGCRGQSAGQLVAVYGALWHRSLAPAETFARGQDARRRVALYPEDGDNVVLAAADNWECLIQIGFLPYILSYMGANPELRRNAEAFRRGLAERLALRGLIREVRDPAARDAGLHRLCC